MNHFRASEHRQHIELVIRQRIFQASLAIARNAIAQNLHRQLAQCQLHKMAHHSWVCTVFQHGSGAAIAAPFANHAGKFLVTHIQRAVEWVSRGHIFIWVPHFNRCIQITHVVVVAPRENGGCINIPCQVYEHVARANMSSKHIAQVLWRDFDVFVSYACLQLIGNAVTVIDKVENGDAACGHFHIAQ